jgi:hypothetical protein
MPSRERREFGADLMEYLLGRHAGRQPSPSCPSGECHLPPRTGNPCLPAPRGEEGWREQRAAARSVCVGVNSSSVRSINQSTSTSKEKRPNEVGWGKKKKKRKMRRCVVAAAVAKESPLCLFWNPGRPASWVREYLILQPAPPLMNLLFFSIFFIFPFRPVLLNLLFPAQS